MALTKIQLPKENLYADGFIVTLKDGVQLLKRNKVIYLGKNPNDKIHNIVQEEKLWNISFKYYGNSKWWHIIADVNNIENPFELIIGDSLLIPDLDTILAGR